MNTINIYLSSPILLEYYTNENDEIFSCFVELTERKIPFFSSSRKALDLTNNVFKMYVDFDSSRERSFVRCHQNISKEREREKKLIVYRFSFRELFYLAERRKSKVQHVRDTPKYGSQCVE